MKEFETPKIKHLQRLIAIQNMCIKNNVSVEEYKRLIDEEKSMFEKLNFACTETEDGE